NYLAFQKQYPDRSFPHRMLAIFYMNQHNLEAARTQFIEALKLWPHDLYLQAYLCYAFNQGQLWEEAVQACSVAIQKNVEYQYPYQQRAEAYRALGKIDLAKKDEAQFERKEDKY